MIQQHTDLRIRPLGAPNRRLVNSDITTVYKFLLWQRSWIRATVSTVQILNSALMTEAVWPSETLATSQLLHGASTQKQDHHQ
jgi:hypothetical protein